MEGTDHRTLPSHFPATSWAALAPSPSPTAGSPHAFAHLGTLPTVPCPHMRTHTHTPTHTPLPSPPGSLNVPAGAIRASIIRALEKEEPRASTVLQGLRL